MLGISTDNFVSSDVVDLLRENLLGQEVDESLDAVGHLLRDLIFVSLEQPTEVEVWICHLEALDIELVLEENLYIVDLLSLPEVLPDLVSQGQDGLDDLLLVLLVVELVVELVILVEVVGAPLV